LSDFKENVILSTASGKIIKTKIKWKSVQCEAELSMQMDRQTCIRMEWQTDMTTDDSSLLQFWEGV